THFADVSDSEVLDVCKNYERKRARSPEGSVLVLSTAGGNDLANDAPTAEGGRYKRCDAISVAGQAGRRQAEVGWWIGRRQNSATFWREQGRGRPRPGSNPDDLYRKPGNIPCRYPRREGSRVRSSRKRSRSSQFRKRF